MDAERKWLIYTGAPPRVASLKSVLNPRSVGFIMHLGRFGPSMDVLLVRQHDQVDDDGFHLWANPAGHVEPRETIWQASEREIGEETGMKLDRPRVQWLCPVGRGGIVFYYEMYPNEIAKMRYSRKHELGIRTLRPPRSVDRNEIDRMAMVPVDVWLDHGLVGVNHVYRQIARKNREEYLYYPASEGVDEEVDFVPRMYRGKIWQAIRHQMIVRRIIPDI